MIETEGRHILALVGQVCSDEIGLRLSQPLGWDQEQPWTATVESQTNAPLEQPKLTLRALD